MRTKLNTIISASLLFAIMLSSCNESGKCWCQSEPNIKDTEFSIAYKLVDGSWDTTKVTLPSTTNFWVGSTENGTYAMYYNEVNGSRAEVFKEAVIDYDIIETKLVLDTAARKVDLLPS